MAGTAVASHWRTPTVVVLILLAIVAGVVASLLVGATPAPPTPRAGELEIDLPGTVWGVLLLAPVAVGMLAFSLMALREGRSSYGPRMLLPFVGIAVAVVFVYLLALGGSGGGGTGKVTLQTNPGNPPGPGPGTPCTNNTSCSHSPGSPGSVQPTQIYSLSLPSWSLAAFGIGVAVIAAALAVPGVIARIVDRRNRGSSRRPDREKVAGAMAEAVQEIDRGHDPREVVVRLYARLLTEVEPRMGDVGPLTAHEIHGRLVDELGVRVSASQALTRLFEEARYSTHAIGTESSGRCREALVQVESDLRRTPDRVAA